MQRENNSQVDKAGAVLTQEDAELKAWLSAHMLMNRWRLAHGYPVNTFQASLRDKIRRINKKALVAQRLKRTPSILAKLKRSQIKLSRMQDIAGLRAIVDDMSAVGELVESYKKSRFRHELVKISDYIQWPKESGYRSVHLVYRYKSDKAPYYNGLFVEIQLRTKKQHAWATAVETAGIFLDQALNQVKETKNGFHILKK